MLTAKQRVALASVVKLIQDVLAEDDAGFPASSRKRRQWAIRDVSEKKLNILRDYNSGLAVKAISEKYGLSHQYVYSIIRKSKNALDPGQTVVCMGVQAGTAGLGDVAKALNAAERALGKTATAQGFASDRYPGESGNKLMSKTEPS